jgi:hypothetical protein
MRLLLYEHVSAAIADNSASPLAALRAEGQAMLSAIAADFAQVPGVCVVTLATADERAFRQEAARADATLVIAPECDGILESRCRWVEDAGSRLLGSGSGVVRLVADKLALGEHWRRHGLPTPPGWLLLPGTPPSSIVGPTVCKPRRGAGSQATFLVHCPEELSTIRAKARGEGYTGELLVQPFVPGIAASVAWLVGPQQALPLLPAEQHLDRDGQFHYRGGRLPLPANLANRAIDLTRRAIACVPGLCGYVGIDLVLGEAADGSGDTLIELNPRLTTSYIGLRTLGRTNLAQTLLRIANGEPTAEPTWNAGTVRFQADGRVMME